MNKASPPPLKLLSMAQLSITLAKSRSSNYADFKDGLLPSPIRISRRRVALPDHEIQQIVAARMAGYTDDQVRALVKALMAARADLIAAPAEYTGLRGDQIAPADRHAPSPPIRGHASTSSAVECTRKNRS
jgi:prophage regulatory protein